jgi:hypothetical protein
MNTLSAHEPQLIASDTEIAAFSAMEALREQPLTYTLTSEQRKQVKELLQAFRRGTKENIYMLSQAYYQELAEQKLFTPERLTSAYFQLHDLESTKDPHYHYRIVMAWLKDNYGQSRPTTLPPISLEEALAILLLAITETKESSLSFCQLQLAEGKQLYKMTTYPLNVTVIQNFLASIGTFPGLLRRVLIFRKQMVIGNPAGLLAHLHTQKRERWLKEHEAWQAAEQLRLACQAQQEQVKQIQQRQNVVIKQTEQLYDLCNDAQEEMAVAYACEASIINELKAQAATPPNVFIKRLQSVYSQKLDAAQAERLAKRMAMAFQTLLQELDRLAGKDKDWFALWNECQPRVVRPSARSSHARPQAPVDDPIADYYARDAQRLSVTKAKEILAAQQASVKQDTALTTQPTPIQSKIFSALSDMQYLDQVLELALSADEQATIPQEVFRLLKRCFSSLSHPMPEFKDIFLAKTRAEHQEAAQLLLLKTERVCIDLSNLARSYRTHDLTELLRIFKERLHQQAQRDKQNASRNLNHPSIKYQQMKNGNA